MLFTISFLATLLVALGIIAILSKSYFFDDATNAKPPTQYKITIQNVSQIPHTLTADNTTKHLPPGYAVSYSLSYGKIITIKAIHLDGTIHTNRHLVTKDEIIKLTASHPTSEQQGSSNVSFYNNSIYPVMIVERSETGGRRWGSEIIPQKTIFNIEFVERRSTWEVVHPTDEAHPIDTITISGQVKKITFDGNHITAT